MSCFILSHDHIGFLLNLGYQLDIRGVTVGDNYQSLALYDLCRVRHKSYYADVVDMPRAAVEGWCLGLLGLLGSAYLQVL